MFEWYRIHLSCIKEGVVEEVERLDRGGWEGDEPIKNPSHLHGTVPQRIEHITKGLDVPLGCSLNQGDMSCHTR